MTLGLATRALTGVAIATLLTLGTAHAGDRKSAVVELADSLHTVAVNGTTLAMLDMGQGEPVVLLHGSAADYRTWLDVIDPLKRQFRVIAYSRRYHYPNKGGGDGRDYSVVLHERDLLALLDSLKLERVHLVGYALGGNIAAQFAVDHPDRVRSLVLAEPEFRGIMKTAARAKEYEDDRRLVYERAWQALSSDIGSLGIEAIADYEFGGDALSAIPRAVQKRLADNAYALKLQVTSPVAPKHLTPEQLAGIKCPVLYVEGGKSPWHAHAMADEFMKAHPTTQRVTLKGDGHGMVWDDPRGFTKAVVGFLDHNTLAGE